LIAAAAACSILQKISRIDLVLAAIACSAGYCLLALTAITRWQLWLPGVLPLGALWLLVIASPFLPRSRNSPGQSAIAVPPPIP
jgi:prepilin signal peptidase PulO-like enzyme (type II secretory pathway)